MFVIEPVPSDITRIGDHDARHRRKRDGVARRTHVAVDLAAGVVAGALDNSGINGRARFIAGEREQLVFAEALDKVGMGFGVAFTLP